MSRSRSTFIVLADQRRERIAPAFVIDPHDIHAGFRLEELGTEMVEEPIEVEP